MSYKLCCRCQFRVPSQNKLCHICGADSFVAITPVHDHSADLITSAGLFEWMYVQARNFFANLFSGFSESQIRASNSSHRRAQPQADLVLSDNNSLEELKKLRQQEIERLRGSFRVQSK